MACKKCLDLVLNVDEFAVRCAKYNKMFWALSSHDDLSNIKTEQDDISGDEFCPVSPLEDTVDESFSSVRFLEVELVETGYKESGVDCNVVKEIYMDDDGNDCDTVANIDRMESGDISNHSYYTEDALHDQYRIEALDELEDSSEKNFQKDPKTQMPKKTRKSYKVLDFPCPNCPKRFVSKRHLKLHDIVHLPDELKKIHSCSECANKFQTISNLNTHFLAVHTNERPFICEECGKAFVNIAGLNQHKVTHATDRPCQCNYCPKTFKDVKHLRKHEEVHNEDTHICLHCGKQLKSKRILRTHMVVHSDQKNYQCHLCELDFKRPKTLKVSSIESEVTGISFLSNICFFQRHLLIHTGF